MSWTLSITGKGGVGKTTLAGLAVKLLVQSGSGPVLAVDADPNSCLDAVLGVNCCKTVGGVREEARVLAQAQSTGGMSKSELLDLKIQEALVETEQFDLVAMGRPEGPGCYCYANNVLRSVLSRLAGRYPSVVIDNEAGLENLSRRTVQNSDWLVFVSDESMRGIRTARRLYDLALELGIGASSFGLVINRMRSSSSVEQARLAFEGTPVKILGALPEDEEIAHHDMLGENVFTLSPDNPVSLGLQKVLDRMLSTWGEAAPQPASVRG